MDVRCGAMLKQSRGYVQRVDPSLSHAAAMSQRYHVLSVGVPRARPTTTHVNMVACAKQACQTRYASGTDDLRATQRRIPRKLNDGHTLAKWARWLPLTSISLAIAHS